jgi:hypothetical protein
MRYARRQRWAILAGAVALVVAGCAERFADTGGVRWQASRTPDSLAVGDPIRLVLDGRWPDSLGSVHLAWAPHPDTLLSVARDSIALTSPEGWTARRYQLAVVPPRAGPLVIPPAALVDARGETLALTLPQTVQVAARRGPQDAGALRPITPMVGLRGFPWLWVVGGAVLLLAALGALGVWSRRKRMVEEAEEIPLPPPGLEFQEGLRHLLARRLAEHGRMRAFTQELSWVLRRYLGRRWQEPALEATRPEILRWMPRTDLSVRDQQEVAAWLEETDGIKFAGRTPLLDEAHTLVERARRVVTRGEELAAEREREAAEREQLKAEGEQREVSR